MKALELENVSKRFLDHYAVKDVSFTVHYGEVLALLGSNGAGKTTTLNMIAGFLIPNNGQVIINNEWTHSNNSSKIKNHLGYLTFDMELYDKFSIRECLQFIGSLRNMTRPRIKEQTQSLIQKLEMYEFIDKKFTELSSGQKQRSLIAATLLHDPQLLILDEITASLDVPTAKMIMDLLNEQKNNGKAILFSTHILSEAEYLSDEIAIIHEGRIMEQSSSLELMDKYEVDNLTDAFCNAVSLYKKDDDKKVG